MPFAQPFPLLFLVPEISLSSSFSLWTRRKPWGKLRSQLRISNSLLLRLRLSPFHKMDQGPHRRWKEKIGEGTVVRDEEGKRVRIGTNHEKPDLSKTTYCSEDRQLQKALLRSWPCQESFCPHRFLTGSSNPQPNDERVLESGHTVTIKQVECQAI